MNLLLLSIRTRLLALTLVFALGLGAFTITAFSTVDAVKINGRKYGEIVANKDLLADVLPPPIYLVETRMVAIEIDEAMRIRDQGRIDALLQRYDQLKQDFNTRAQFWKASLPEGVIRTAVFEGAVESGNALLEQMDRKFLPAVRSGDEAAVAGLLAGELQAAFERHRIGIDKVVELGGVASTELERSSAGLLRARAGSLLLLALLLLAVTTILSLFIVRTIVEPLATANQAAHSLAKGDLTVRLDESGNDEIAKFSAALNQAIDSLRGSLVQVSEAATAVGSASQQLTGAAENISGGAQEQASSLEETAATLEELTSTVKQNADNAQQAAQLAQGARDVAEKGGHVVNTAVNAMHEINDASRKIADIITAIDEIAFQTNLLALNAAVEAARAGEQGRGFAVVAGEVRNLAQRSAKAAKEIKGLIQDTVEKVESGSRLVNQSGETLDEIMVSVKKVTDLIAEIAAASREQSTGIDQVNTAVTQMDSVTQANASQTEELAGTSEALASQARELMTLVEHFRLGAAGSNHSETQPAESKRTATVSRLAARRAPRLGADAAVRPAALAEAAARTGTHGGFEEF